MNEEEYVNPSFKEGYQFFDKKSAKIKISPNQLFIWKCDQNDGEISKSILNWFNGFNLIGNPYPSNIDFAELYAANSDLIYNTKATRCERSGYNLRNCRG